MSPALTHSETADTPRTVAKSVTKRVRRPRTALRVPKGFTLGSIDYATPGQQLGEGATGSWLFLVRDGVRLADAWEAVVADFRRYLRRHRTTYGYDLNHGDVVDDCPPRILWRHGLVFVSFPVRDRLEVDHDAPVIDWHDLDGDDERGD